MKWILPQAEKKMEILIIHSLLKMLLQWKSQQEASARTDEEKDADVIDFFDQDIFTAVQNESTISSQDDHTEEGKDEVTITRVPTKKKNVTEKNKM